MRGLICTLPLFSDFASTGVFPPWAIESLSSFSEALLPLFLAFLFIFRGKAASTLIVLYDRVI